MPFGHPPPRRLGYSTRGKTAAGRLRHLDAFVARYDPGLIRRTDGAFRDAVYVDLGFGDHPVTTLEAARMMRRLRPDLRFVGVEIDRERVESARAMAPQDPITTFRLGGFNLPLGTSGDAGARETVRLVRAFNVLRQYEEAEAEAACDVLGAQLLPGGLLVEGTSDPSGSLWCASLLRRAEPTATGPLAARRASATYGAARQALHTAPTRLVGEGLVFGLRWRAAFRPASFRPVLPKCWHHRVMPGEPIYAFFEAWERAWTDVRSQEVWGPRFAFARAAERLAEAGFRVDLRGRFVRRGTLLWRDGNPWPPSEHGGVQP